MEREATAKISDIEQVTVASGVLEKLLGVTDSRIRQLTREGILFRASKGRYLLFRSVQNYIKTLKIQRDIQAGGEGKEIDYEEEKAKHEQVKRMQAELRLALMRGELHKSSDVELVMTDMLVGFRSRLLQLPTKIAPLLLEKQDVGEVKERLTKEIREVLEELQEYDAKHFYSEDFVELEEGEIASDTAGEIGTDETKVGTVMRKFFRLWRKPLHSSPVLFFLRSQKRGTAMSK